MNKLMIIGDSVLKGVTYDAGAGRYKLYDSTLETRLAERQIEAKRFCRMGSTVTDGHQRLAAMIENGDDLRGVRLLLELGGNDCDFDWSAVSDAPDEQHLPHTEPEQFSELYEETVRLARENGAEVAVSTLVPIDAEKYLAFISRGRSYDNILRWLGDASMLYRWHESYNNAVTALAVRLGCPVVDLRSLFLRSHDFPALLSEDGIHPTARGHRMIEDYLVSAI